MRQCYSRIALKYPKLWPLMHALGFTVVDTSLYFLSENNFFKHIDQSRSPVSDLKQENDGIYLGFIIAGSACTFVATLASYSVRIKNYTDNEYKNDRTLALPYPFNRILLVIASLSILNKSIATSSSAFALAHDFIEESAFTWPVFAAALVSNLLVQAVVQLNAMDSHGKFSKKIAKPLSIFFTTIYNSSLLMLNWNTINSVFITCKFILPEERITFANMSDTVLSTATVSIAMPLFLCAAVSNELKFIPSMIERLTSKKEENDIETQISCGNKAFKTLYKYTAMGNAIQRTLLMFLAFAALIFGFCEDKDALGYALGFGLALLCLPGNAMANYTLFVPKIAPEEKCLLSENQFRIQPINMGIYSTSDPDDLHIDYIQLNLN